MGGGRGCVEWWPTTQLPRRAALNEQLRAALEPHRAAVEAALKAAVPTAEDCPQKLSEAIGYALLSPGKRLRPVLTRLACLAAGGEADDANEAAVAVECVHAYSLVHDDLPAMDDDDLRRGRPTCHRQFDEATAILAGDALLTLAFERAAASRRPAECVTELARAAGACGMVGGQAADLDAETTAVTDVEALTAIHRRKTGRLIAAACVLGGHAGGASGAVLESLREYGLAIGLAFQVADDLLDATGDAATMGKAVNKDAGRGKATYPGLLGVDESRARADDLVTQAVDALGDLRIATGAPEGGEAARAVETLAGVARYVIERDR